jgi:hypothetical protein
MLKFPVVMQVALQPVAMPRAFVLKLCHQSAVSETDQKPIYIIMVIKASL